MTNLQNDSLITCPECQHEFSLSSELKKNLEAKSKKEMARQMEQIKAENRKEKINLEAIKKNLEQEKLEQDKILEDKILREKKRIWAQAQKLAEEKIKKEQNLKLKDLENQNEENQKKIEAAGKKELEFLKEKRALETQQKNLELELERKLNEKSLEITERAKKEAEESGRMKILEYQKQNEMMQKQIEELRRKSEQGSMQIQGEVQENDLREKLKATFFSDQIDDVPTGIRGADLVQRVRDNLGKNAGVIIWESKNTKTWSKDWLKKLKDDQAAIGADLCILVSQVLPEEIQNFGFHNGVWIVGYPHAMALVSTLRFHLLEMKKMQHASQNKDQNMETLYNYLSSPQFKNKIENIVLAFDSMKKDLESEKAALQRIWNKRQKEIDRVMLNTSGFYGDLQGIIGNSLPTIDQLELGGGAAPSLL